MNCLAWSGPALLYGVDAAARANQLGGQLLQAVLRVAESRLGGDGGDSGPEKLEHEAPRSLDPGDKYTAPMTASRQSARMDDLSRPPELSSPCPSSNASPIVERLRHGSQGERAHHGRTHPGEVAFGQIREGGEEVVGHDEAEDGVAEELEPLVGLLRRRLGAEGPV